RASHSGFRKTPSGRTSIFTLRDSVISATPVSDPTFSAVRSSRRSRVRSLPLPSVGQRQRPLIAGRQLSPAARVAGRRRQGPGDAPLEVARISVAREAERRVGGIPRQPVRVASRKSHVPAERAAV